MSCICERLIVSYLIASLIKPTTNVIFTSVLLRKITQFMVNRPNLTEYRERM